jgi:Ni/Co efflux regulator RcnB
MAASTKWKKSIGAAIAVATLASAIPVSALAQERDGRGDRHGGENRGWNGMRPGGGEARPAPEMPRGPQGGGWNGGGGRAGPDAARPQPAPPQNPGQGWNGGQRSDRPAPQPGWQGNRPGDGRPGEARPGWNGGRPGENRPGWNDGRPGDNRPGWNGGRPGENRPGWNGGRPGDNRPGWNNGRPGDNRPGWNNGRPGDNRPGWNNGRPGWNDGRPGWNNGRPGWGDSRWRNEWRQDRRYDWRGWRDSHRDFFRGPRYYSPIPNYRYSRLNIGLYLGAPFFAQQYWISDPWAYRLPPAEPPYRWVRYYDDVVLIDTYTGQVVDVIYDFFW